MPGQITTTRRAKILLLHGNGQSGDFFRCKTRFLHEPILRAFESAAASNAQPMFDTLQFSYPDGPIPTPPPDTTTYPEEPSTFNWGYGDLTGGNVLGVEKAFEALLHELATNGPYIGIIGFSAGAALSIVAASLLENQHLWQPKWRIKHPPLEFIVSFAGFVLDNEQFAHAYGKKLQTPILHFLGDLDPLVSEAENQKLLGHCEWPLLVRFFGAHAVPRGRGVAEGVAGFIEDAMGWTERWGWEDV